MTIMHHPNAETLGAFAAGTLDEARATGRCYPSVVLPAVPQRARAALRGTSVVRSWRRRRNCGHECRERSIGHWRNSHLLFEESAARDARCTVVSVRANF